MFIHPEHIRSFFRLCNDTPVRYVLIKNIGDELPDKLKNGKDIDILVHAEDMKAFEELMKENNYRKVVHPCGSENGWRFGYQLEEPVMWEKNNIQETFRIDVSDKLCCHSFTEKVWIPLDKEINRDVWEYRYYDEKKQWWRMDDTTTLIYLIVRCIFDKQCFSPEYVAQIEAYQALLNQINVQKKLEKVFFKFTPYLTELLLNKKYDDILKEYVTFTDY